MNENVNLNRVKSKIDVVFYDYSDNPWVNEVSSKVGANNQVKKSGNKKIIVMIILLIIIVMIVSFFVYRVL